MAGLIGWIQAGERTFLGVRENRITAVLYWQPAEVGELHEPGGEPIVQDAGWGLAYADDPSNHLSLGIEGRDEVAEAMDGATGMLLNHLDRKEG